MNWATFFRWIAGGLILTAAAWAASGEFGPGGLLVMAVALTAAASMGEQQHRKDRDR